MTSEFSETMLELFRAEVESHSETLSNSLLKLERDPTDAGVLDSIMRAAHSIKGAARIVGVASAVDVAHLMEDCFVAARRGELTIRSSDIDVLLTSVDLLAQIAESTRQPQASRTDLAGLIASSLRQLRDLREGRLSAESTSSILPSGQASSIPFTPSVPVESTVQGASPGSGEPEHSAGVKPPDQPETGSVAASLPPAVSDRAARVVVLTFGDSLSRADAELMRGRLLEELNAGRCEVRFDLSATRQIDPTGVAFIAAARDYVATQTDSRLTLDPLSAEMELVIRLTGIGRS